ncbi:MAG: ABC transporter ATP-binding protein [Betaproteobacteria bacterium]|jgi:iron(III) transport system ATP-binding protein|nr:ABC transporter ATP-binding protein [Betaproteobacteria bacterium]NBX89218.1 ABC transporter ATP-binding protein [Betaproteobacteria bacterium]
MKKVAIECRNIHLAYGQTQVLKDVSLHIAPGEFFALLGPSGSGKSSLLRLIAGFNRQQQGQLLIDGQDMSPKAPWERNVGMVFQSYALWPHMSVWDNVAFGLVERKVEPAILKAKVLAVLEQVGLSEFAQRRPNQLSGGQQQRVALARTIVVEPQVLLLDEPLSNLDKSLRTQMRQELLSMQRRLGLTTVFVTHDQEEAMATADRMAVLDKGVVQQVGTAQALYDSPANRFVANFVGTMNVLTVQALRYSTGELHLRMAGLPEVTLPWPETPVQTEGAGLCFRPHAVDMVLAQQSENPQRFWLPGEILSSEFMGNATRYQVKVGLDVLTVDQAHHAGGVKWAPHTFVKLGLHPEQVQVVT